MLSPADGKKDFSHYTLFLKHLYPLLCSFFKLLLPISMHTRFTHLVIHLMTLHILHNTHAYHHPSIPNFLIFFPTTFSFSTPHIHFFFKTPMRHISISSLFSISSLPSSMCSICSSSSVCHPKTFNFKILKMG